MTMNERSRENMVFTTYEQVRWAAMCTKLPDDPTPIDRSLEPPQMPNSWVYFIQAGDNGPIKIGYSKDPYMRFSNIQMGSAVEHTYLGNIPGDRAVEHALHQKFDQHRIRGEWFRPAPEILKYIDEHRLRPETQWRPEAIEGLPDEQVTYKEGISTLF